MNPDPGPTPGRPVGWPGESRPRGVDPGGTLARGKGQSMPIPWPGRAKGQCPCQVQACLRTIFQVMSHATSAPPTFRDSICIPYLRLYSRTLYRRALRCLKANGLKSANRWSQSSEFRVYFSYKTS